MFLSNSITMLLWHFLSQSHFCHSLSQRINGLYYPFLRGLINPSLENARKVESEKWMAEDAAAAAAAMMKMFFKRTKWSDITSLPKIAPTLLPWQIQPSTDRSNFAWILSAVEYHIWSLLFPYSWHLAQLEQFGMKCFLRPSCKLRRSITPS